MTLLDSGLLDFHALDLLHSWPFNVEMDIRKRHCEGIGELQHYVEWLTDDGRTVSLGKKKHMDMAFGYIMERGGTRAIE